MPDPSSRLRYVVYFLGVVLAAGVLYDAGVFYSRWNEARQAGQALADAETKQERRVVNALGGGELKILSFYATPGEVCYSVTGAKTVRIEPPIGEVWPALSRCTRFSPRKNTTYTLVAEDGAGHSVSESFTP